MAHATQVLTAVGLALGQDGEGVLLLCPYPQDGGGRGGICGGLDLYRAGHVPAGTAIEQGFASLKDPQHRVVAAVGNVPVVKEEVVGDPSQPRQGVPVVGYQGKPAPVAASHHQAPGACRQQHLMERGVGEHHPQGPHSWRHCWGDWLIGDIHPCLQDHNGRPGSRQLSGFSRGQVAVMGHNVTVPGHQSKGLVGAPFAPSEKGHHPWVGGITGEMEAAQALDSQDRALSEKARCRQDGAAWCLVLVSG